MTVSEKSRWLILLVVSSALFLIVIDMTVLYTALPSLARDLGTDASEKLWIINAYALVVAGLLPALALDAVLLVAVAVMAWRARAVHRA
jgi:DHA2 family multidrug resistance protein-like MFS transporter